MTGTAHEASDTGAPRGFARKVASLFIGLVSLILLTSLSITLYTIVSRNLGYSTDDWVLKLPETMLGWMTFLGMGALVAEGGHVAADMFITMASRSTQRLAYAGWSLVAAGVLGLILAGSISIVLQTYAIGQTNAEIFDLPQWLILLPLPVGLTITIMHLLIEVAAVRRRAGPGL
jgi:TRAP-type C4-dicarboxylate transport system permease small subunit